MMGLYCRLRVLITTPIKIGERDNEVGIITNFLTFKPAELTGPDDIWDKCDYIPKTVTYWPNFKTKK